MILLNRTYQREEDQKFVRGLLGAAENRPDMGHGANYHIHATADAGGGTSQYWSSTGEEVPAWDQRG